MTRSRRASRDEEDFDALAQIARRVAYRLLGDPGGVQEGVDPRAAVRDLAPGAAEAVAAVTVSADDATSLSLC